MKRYLNVEVDCPLCAQKIEAGIKKVEGVDNCSVNYVTQKMMIEIKDELFDSVMKKVIKTAKRIESDFRIEL